MEVVCERGCGLDVHQKTVVACLVATREDGQVTKEVRTFGTMTADLLELLDWLTLYDVTHVAMESTGVYWKPIYNILEGNVELLLVNAQHIKAVPGRKTDVRDCEWIADLLRHGLLRASFVPDRAQRELRELTRYRTALVRERATEANRLQKVLEGANIKLGAVASDVLGRSGRAMLAALVAGTSDPTQLAQLARKRLRDKIPQLEQALRGHFAEHQRFLVGQQLRHLDQLEDLIRDLSAEVTRRLQVVSCENDANPPAAATLAAPPAATTAGSAEESEKGRPASPDSTAIERLVTIPGIGQRTAEILVAEIGTDMSRFPSAKHLAAWAGMAPGNNESAGKRRNGKTRKGSPWLRSALTEAGQAAGRTKGTYLSAQFHRLAARRGKKKAVIAVGHTIVVIAYHLLQRGTTYQDLGGNYFDERERETVTQRLIGRLKKLGVSVTIERPAEAVPA
jgi:transposase